MEYEVKEDGIYKVETVLDTYDYKVMVMSKEAFVEAFKKYILEEEKKSEV